jgi:hypothetical protein
VAKIGVRLFRVNFLKKALPGPNIPSAFRRHFAVVSSSAPRQLDRSFFYLLCALPRLSVLLAKL